MDYILRGIDKNSNKALLSASYVYIDIKLFRF